jgi:hypothetical protein
MYTKGQDIQRANRIARASGPARWAAVDPSVLAPLPAYGTRLRGIGFAEGDCPSRFVVEQLDDLARAGGTYLLRLLASDTLCCVVERLTHIAGGVGEGLGHLARGLVAQVADPPMRFVEHRMLAALQPLIAPRMLSACRLALADAGKLFVTVLHRRLGRASTDENDLLPIGGSNQRVHAQVYPDDRLLWARDLRNFTDQAHHAIGEPHLHEPPRQRDGIRQADAQRPAEPVGQNQPPIADTRILIGVDDIVIATQPPRVARLLMTVRAQLATGVYRLAELPDELLRALGRQAGIAPFSLAFPTQLAGPLPPQLAHTVMPYHQIIPETCSLFAAGAEGGPLGCRAWRPRMFYCAVAHVRSVPDRRIVVKRSA